MEVRAPYIRLLQGRRSLRVAVRRWCRWPATWQHVAGTSGSAWSMWPVRTGRLATARCSTRPRRELTSSMAVVDLHNNETNQWRAPAVRNWQHALIPALPRNRRCCSPRCAGHWSNQQHSSARITRNTVPKRSWAGARCVDRVHAGKQTARHRSRVFSARRGANV